MKTETQIAKRNLQRDEETNGEYGGECEEHKASCQRFLEFLEEEMKKWETIQELQKKVYISTGELEEKITDLKQAIKLYGEVGI